MQSRRTTCTTQNHLTKSGIRKPYPLEGHLGSGQITFWLRPTFWVLLPNGDEAQLP